MNPTFASSSPRVLVLGGTGEARSLAAVLVGEGWSVVSSLAGRVSAPALPVGELRTGGFGGVEGLMVYLAAEPIAAVVDATHPFAANITAHAAQAATASGVPLLRLQRPGWSTHELASTFHWVDSVGEARVAAEPHRRPFLTTGRQQLHEFAGWHDRYVLARVVDPPDWVVPATWEVLRARGPYTHAAELDLMSSRAIDVLVTKDSGGPLTEAKLRAATDLDVAVVVVRRPALPTGLVVVDTVGAARDWLQRLPP
ncbi:precorrin-6A reductase [Humibacillus sp. DSM 29435]|uniref:cobalt-precorrin-6A reductase n=1 Tax=Humibacillus sp. DSM 29435 TaxID=1869167 RepID=UPI000873371A|nr:cobalt-precorrin-6A reductase [Humibacillus sp. DSM 29435]OFE17847.1 precorrin-6A reductase [Humibacillus sp. DSM 29435]